MIRTSYLGKVYHVKKFTNTIDNLVYSVNRLKEIHGFDAIAFTGSSGAAVGYTISYLTKLPVIYLRKDESHHSHLTIEGEMRSKKYLIIDDRIISGDTVNRIVNLLSVNTSADPVGILLYYRLWGKKRNKFRMEIGNRKLTLPIYYS